MDISNESRKQLKELAKNENKFRFYRAYFTALNYFQK
jgi:uncharacterized protein YpbB